MQPTQESAVIRPLPIVFEDYKEKIETVQESNNLSLNKMLSSVGKRGTLLYITTRVDYPEKGMLMYYKDVPYPRQGFVFPEALDTVNNLKRLTVLFLAILKGRKGRGLIKGRIEAALGHYCWIADWMLQFYEPSSKQILKVYLKENRYRQSVREIIKFINSFLDNLGIIPFYGEKKDFGKVIGTMIEYDNAYYWRIEDIFGETSKEKLLKNPRKEVKRLLQIYKQREKATEVFKAEALQKAFNYLLLIPKVKKAFKKAIESIEVENLKMTLNDSYYTMNYEGYDFQGKSIEERLKIWLEMSGGKPPERILIPQ